MLQWLDLSSVSPAHCTAAFVHDACRHIDVCACTVAPQTRAHPWQDVLPPYIVTSATSAVLTVVCMAFMLVLIYDYATLKQDYLHQHMPVDRASYIPLNDPAPRKSQYLLQPSYDHQPPSYQSSSSSKSYALSERF